MTETLGGLTYADVGCPQCGARVRVPRHPDFFRCASCGSTLFLAQGTPTHVLREKTEVSPQEAGGILRGWLGKQAYVVASAPTIGELRFLPFLRVKTGDQERVTPLVPVPSPAAAQLAYAPGQLIETDGPVDGIDRDSLESAVGTALEDPAVRAVQVEFRGYYPATYALTEQEFRPYSAVIGAGQGGVYVDALPARSFRSVSRLRWYLPGLAALLIAEAAAVPGLWPSVAAVAATSVVACGAILARGLRRG